jgi:hypothetical protein
MYTFYCQHGNLCWYRIRISWIRGRPYTCLYGCLEKVAKPHIRQKYILEKNDWFPRDDTPEHAAYDKRTPGLFKEEYRGDGIVAVTVYITS